MDSRLLLLTGRGHAEASSSRREIAEEALAERNRARLGGRPLPAYGSVAEYAAALAPRTACMTLLAGSGSRWATSLAAAAARGEASGPEADPARPRGLYPVRDFLRGGARIPIAAYALAAVDGIGCHLIVVRGWEAEIDAEILAPLGITERRYFTQDAPHGKPLGHGDAAWQCRELWRGADYVVTNFGGDANSRRTILSSLLVLDALRAMGEDVGLIVPAAPFDSPAYPIGLDAEGLPRSFGHAKLQGSFPVGGPVGAPGGSPPGKGYANVGVRVYSAPALLEQVQSFRERCWVEGEGYAIPGNDPAGHEFALDNVDAELARQGRARMLAIARPEELTPAKSLGEIPAFEAAARSVVVEDISP
jgi:hypothetical protein